MPEFVDRRAAERMPVGSGAVCGFAGMVAGDLGPVKPRDVSMHGVGLVLSKRVEVGTVLAVTLTNPNKGFSKTVLVRVTHTTPIPGGFLVGGDFTEPITYQDLTSLVM